nr:unnamed protein product [Naegleria fowleri]
MRDLFNLLCGDENVCLHVLTFLDMSSICIIHRVNKHFHNLLESTVGDRCIYGLKVYQIAFKILNYSSEFKKKGMMMNEALILNFFIWGHKAPNNQTELDCRSSEGVGTNSSNLKSFFLNNTTNSIVRRINMDRNKPSLFKEILKEFYFFPFHRIGFRSEAYASYKSKHDELLIERWRPCKLIAQILKQFGNSIQDVIVDFQNYLMMYTQNNWSLSKNDVGKSAVMIEAGNLSLEQSRFIEIPDISDSDLLFHYLDKFSSLLRMYEVGVATKISIKRSTVTSNSWRNPQYDMKTPTECEDIFCKAQSSVRAITLVGGLKKQIEYNLSTELSEMREELFGNSKHHAYVWTAGCSAYNARQQVFIICPKDWDVLKLKSYEKHISF